MSDLVFTIEKRSGKEASGTLSWPAQNLSTTGISGPHGKGALPVGTYGADTHLLLDKEDSSYADSEGNCWMQPMVWKDSGRTDLGIHPDGNVRGTLGCIGIDPTKDTSVWYKAFKQERRVLTVEVVDSKTLLEEDNAADEASIWAGVSTTAVGAVSFFASFLGARMSGSKTTPLSPAAAARLLLLVRAVSWVESRHGTGVGATAAKDPMQCGQDIWWKELCGLTTAQSYWVRGPGLTTLSSKELPSAVDKLGAIPVSANIAKWTSPGSGNKHPQFNATTSYYWGVPWLMHRINTKAGDPVYQFGDLSRNRLIDGAVAYNGGGDPNYRAKIENALTLIGGLNGAPEIISARATEGTVGVTEMIRELLSDLRNETDAPSRVLFPDGIDLIEVDLKIGAADGVECKLRLAGKSSGTSIRSGGT